MRKDYHLHTEVSDGRWLPADIFRTAPRLGIDEISITDHDAVGAYIHFGDVRRDAAAAGIRLVPGVELDSAHGGVEIHMLGYELDPVHPGLTAYLGEVQRLRRDRLQALVGRINDALDAPALDAAAVFRPWRDTCMMPHLIQPLLVDGRFPDYRTARRWIKETVGLPVEVPKPAVADVIALIRAAGGWAALAHPGFCSGNGDLDLEAFVAACRDWGMTGLEVEYRYRGSVEFPSRVEEDQFVARMRELARRFGLRATRGSDAHQAVEMEAFAAD